MDKRVSSRGVIIEDNNLITLFRRKLINNKIMEYYSLPGGGLEENESIEESVIRELKEELSVDVIVRGYVGKRETDTAVEYYFDCSIVEGTPILGGEEKEQNNPNNYYEVRKLPLSEIYNVDLLGQNLIIKALNKEYIHLDEKIV